MYTAAAMEMHNRWCMRQAKEALEERRARKGNQVSRKRKEVTEENKRSK